MQHYDSSDLEIKNNGHYRACPYLYGGSDANGSYYCLCTFIRENYYD